jgi:hypothetical protein
MAQISCAERRKAAPEHPERLAAAALKEEQDRADLLTARQDIHVNLSLSGVNLPGAGRAHLNRSVSGPRR